MIVNHLSRLAGERRWSIKKVAAEAGLSYSTVHDFYQGKSKRHDENVLDQLCRALGVGVADILEYRPDTSDQAAFDDEPWTAEDQAALDEGLADLAAGRVASWADVEARLFGGG